MKRIAVLATELCNKEITTDDAFKVLMALKLSRLSFSSDHFDSFVDLIGYTEGWWKYRQEESSIKDFEPPHPHHKAKTITELHPKIDSLFPFTEEQARERNAPVQGASAEKLEHLMKVTAAIQLLSGEGYRIFGPELTNSGHSFTESMDWKDQHPDHKLAGL